MVVNVPIPRKETTWPNNAPITAPTNSAGPKNPPANPIFAETNTANVFAANKINKTSKGRTPLNKSFIVLIPIPTASGTNWLNRRR